MPANDFPNRVDFAMGTRFQPLDNLPLFASEEALSAAIMGPGHSEDWRQIATLLEARGFPKIDGLMGGRYVPAIRKFFDHQYDIAGATVAPEPHATADLGAWKRQKTTGRRD